MLALVIGSNGQDGTYLGKLLREKGYDVLGLNRESETNICNASSVAALIRQRPPREIYFLAAFHHSAEDPPIVPQEDMARSFEVNTLALNHVLGAIQSYSPETRLFYAASSRIFGTPPGPIQDENTPVNPVCSYGISKAAGVYMCRYYRTRGIFASTGIVYNHESPLRSSRFVTRKVVSAAVRISRGSPEKLTVGNLDAQVDWGYAPDFARAMWQILQLDQAEDFVIGTGVLHSVRELVEIAFGAVGLNWTDHVIVQQSLLQGPASRSALCADPGKLKQRTGWQPSLSFEEMILRMVTVEATGK